jgi:hypothetical protein
VLTCVLASGLAGCFEQPSTVESEGFTARSRGKQTPAAEVPVISFDLPPVAGPPEPLPPAVAGGTGSPETVAAVSLALTPTSVTVSSGGTIDLRATVQAIATLAGGGTRDVSRDVFHDQPVGGTLSGSLFHPAQGVSTASVRFLLAQSGQTPVVALLPISVSPSALRPVSLALTPSAVTLPTGTVYGLRANLQASVRFDDGTTADVSRFVSYSEPVNCRLEEGGSLIAGQTAGQASVSVLFANAAGGVTAPFALTLQPDRPKVTSLTLTPATTNLPAGATLDLRTVVRAQAGFEGGSTADVSADLTYGPASGGRGTGSVFTAPATAGPVSVALSYASGGGSVTRTFTIIVPASTEIYPTLLLATPTGASIAGPVDLRTILLASAWFSDGTARDVTREVGFVALAGGSASGTSFFPSPEATTGRVRLTFSNPRGEPLTAAASFGIAVPAAPILTAIAATSVLTVTVGSRLGLRTAVSVRASFADATTRDVSHEVSYLSATGGSLEGEVFVAPGQAGAGSVGLSYESGGTTRTALVAIDIRGILARPVSLALTPTSVLMEAGEELSLRATIQAVAAFDDGTAQDLSSRTQFAQATGGTLDGAVFRAGGRGTGSVIVLVESSGVTVSRTLAIGIVDTVDGAPASLALSPALVALEPGGTLDLLATVQALATLTNGSIAEVSGRVSYATTTPGATVTSGRFLRTSPGISSGTVEASYSARGRTVRRTLTFLSGRSRRVPTALVTEPATLGVVAGARLDLAMAASCLATFQDGTREDVTRTVSYSNPAGGRLEGRLFLASELASAGSVLVSYTSEGVTRQALLRLTIHRSEPGLVSLGLSPSAVRLAAGSRYGLAANVRVSAGYDDGTTGTVSSGVDWRVLQGGRVVEAAWGPSFEPAMDSGTASAIARYTAGGATRSATLSIEIVPALPAGVGLSLTPPRGSLVPRSALLLPENVSLELRRQDGSLENVTRWTRWVSPVGGTLSQSVLGTVFTAGPSESMGSVTAVVQDGEQTLVAVLPLEIVVSAGTAKDLPEAAVGVPYRARLADLLGSEFGAAPRTLGQPLAGSGLTATDGVVAGTPTTPALLAIAVTEGGTAPAVFDTLFLEVRKTVVLAEPKPMARAALPTSRACEETGDSGARSCVNADLDGDGLDDRVLLAGSDGHETVQVRLAGRHGRYLAPRTVASAPGALAAEAADVDGDGLTDLVLVRPDGGLWLRNLTPR